MYCNDESIKKLIEATQKDPQLFHDLVFKTEATLSKLEFLDRREKAALIANRPEDLIGMLIGKVSWCGNTCSSSCDNTCGGSCGYTTNLQSRFGDLANFGSLANCGNTCSSSCDNTCGGSCGYTTNLTDFERFRSNPGYYGAGR